MKHTAALMFIIASAAPALAATPEAPPFIKPYEGSVPAGVNKKIEFDEYELPVGKVEKGKGSLQHLEGKISTFTFSIPKGRSNLEVYKNYESALRQAGFEIVFHCKGPECGGWMQLKWIGGYPNAPDGHYAAAKLARPEGDVWLGLGVSGNTGMAFIELKPMETGKVAVVKAEALSADLVKSGHAAVYGILFDTNKAEVKPESQATLAEIGKLMSQNASLQLHVVGHTDSTGDFAANMDLSRRRADAVVKVLTSGQGVAANRLHAEGVGPLAPVATNRTEEGKAKNRRVELVER